MLILDVQSVWYPSAAKDSGGPYNYNLITALVNTAEAHGLDFAIDDLSALWSDVEATLRAGYDIRHGLIGPGFMLHIIMRDLIWME